VHYSVAGRRDLLYARVKASVLTTAATSDSSFDISTYQVATTAEDSATNIRKINSVLHQAKYKVIELNCILGLEIANYKYLFYVSKCDNCESSTDRFAILSCAHCRKMKENINSLKQFFRNICMLLDRTKDWINFLINLGRLCSLYPKFKYVTLALNQLKPNINWLPDSMKQDQDFWQIV